MFVIREAVQQADLIALLIPDEIQAKVYEEPHHVYVPNLGQNPAWAGGCEKSRLGAYSYA